jgi:hypothetical protein
VIEDGVLRTVDETSVFEAAEVAARAVWKRYLARD